MSKRKAATTSIATTASEEGSNAGGVATEQNSKKSTASAAAASGTTATTTDYDTDDDLLVRQHHNQASKDITCRRCRAFHELEQQSRLEQFLTELPKNDLHVHLDGSPRIETLIELAQKHGVTLPAYTVEGLRATVFKEHYDSLVEYLSGFPLIVQVLQKPGALERIAYEFAWDCMNEGVRYVEPRFAPQLIATKDMDVIGVLKAAAAGLDRAKNEFNARASVKNGEEPPFSYGIITCAMRMFLADFSEYYRDFCSLHRDEPSSRHYQLASVALAHAAINAKKEHGLPIVGIDIAGQEAGFPAKEHSESFVLAHKNWLGKTVHAGEAFGPESIFQAITDLHVERLGHGYHLFSADRCVKKENPQEFVDGLVQYVAKSRIMLEVCLTSNYQTMVELRGDLSKHRLKDMLSHGICVSLCTDNRLVSNTTVVKELMLAINHFQLTPTELKTILLEGFKRSFFPGTYLQKRNYLKRVINFYESVERRYGLHDWYVSSDSILEDRHHRGARTQKSETENENENGNGNGGLDCSDLCEVHAERDRTLDSLTMSPQWRSAAGPRMGEESEGENGEANPGEGGGGNEDKEEEEEEERDRHRRKRHLEMPPEVFM